MKPDRRYRVTVLQDAVTPDGEALARLLEHLQAAKGALGLPSPAGDAVHPEVRRFFVPKKIIPASTVYEGIASDVVDGVVDLNLDNGEAVGFYEDDPGLLIEEI